MTVSFPTELNPWYVLVHYKSLSHLGQDYYYHNVNEGEEAWQERKHGAALFLNLKSAIRIAKAEACEIQVLWDKEQLKLYGRDTF